MNIDNANILLSWLRAGAPHAQLDMTHSVIEPQRWLENEKEYNEHSPDMVESVSRPDCGTVCCIAGAADQLRLGGGVFPKIAIYDRELTYGGSKSWDLVGENALDWLGLERVTEENCLKTWGVEYDDSMFHPLFDPILAPEGCTPGQAADALERLMQGEFPWPDFLPS